MGPGSAGIPPGAARGGARRSGPGIVPPRTARKPARQDRRWRNYSSEHWRSSRTRVGRMGNTLGDFVSRLRGVAAVQTLGGLPDRELLGRFVESNDESAFSVLVERHGAMVLAVCR